MDWIKDFNNWSENNPLDLSVCDNYEPWGGTQGGEKSPTWGMKHTQEWSKHMSELHTGKGNPFYGKTHTENTKNKMRESARLRGAKNCYKFFNPMGECVIINGSLKKFCNDNGLNSGAMSQVHLGKKPQYKGWRRG